ncbi:hypothetical protein EI94DRAFT_1724058 [Lactarius quietus]|nr:hypothetical protein EI94DRAFT_1724058 [Lactarius quietus]
MIIPVNIRSRSLSRAQCVTLLSSALYLGLVFSIPVNLFLYLRIPRRALYLPRVLECQLLLSSDNCLPFPPFSYSSLTTFDLDRFPSRSTLDTARMYIRARVSV